MSSLEHDHVSEKPIPPERRDGGPSHAKLLRENGRKAGKIFLRIATVLGLSTGVGFIAVETAKTSNISTLEPVFATAFTITLWCVSAAKPLR